MAPKAFASITAWYNTLANFNVETFFSRKRAAGPPRSVFVNEQLPPDYYDKKQKVKKEHVFATNQVITSKYTIITFLPRNLLEQFRRVANCFFLAIAILQFFSIFSTISPGLAILPLLIVLTFSALKDGYEDIKRHQSDRHVNYSLVRTLTGGGWVNSNPMESKEKTFVRGFVPSFKKRPKKKKLDAAEGQRVAMELSQGAPPEGVRIEGIPNQEGTTNGEEYDDDTPVETPGTGGLLHHHYGSKRPHWKITTWEDVSVGDIVKIMDDEAIPADVLICSTSEEENVAFVETKNLDGETNLKSRSANPALTHIRRAQDVLTTQFHVECDRPDTNLYKLNAAVVHGGQKTPVDIQQILLRGTILRNTGWIIGIVLFTGEDTKIVLNSGNTPSKRSKVERQMNPQVFTNLGILACMAITLGIVDAVLEQRYFPMDAPWLYGDTAKDDNPKINGLVTWAFALITFQNIVPISLYISIEFVRTVQALWIYFDKEIYYEKTNQPTLARSWNLSDDLGQIEYIFSDKTGTLTQNAMVFRQCSIGGKAYQGDDDEETVGEADGDKDKLKIIEEPLYSKRLSGDSSTPSASGSGPTPKVEGSTDKFPVPDARKAAGVGLADGVLKHFSDHVLSDDLTSAVSFSPDADVSAYANVRALHGFWLTLALCHTVLTGVDQETGTIEYKAQSPDEAALVQAAADVGFVFRGREKEFLYVSTPFSNGVERYELLNVLEFNSSRKRMSVIVRKVDIEQNSHRDEKLIGGGGQTMLLTKGADNMIFERLRAGNEELKRITEQHLADFANDGLRTLTLAYKIIPDDEYEDWGREYHEASVALENREELVDAVCEKIETNLRLLGATAIEDRLQDGVPETIADLKEAGIKIWVATGDKLETAIAIGHSTNLIGREDNIIIIRGGSSDNELPVYSQMLGAVDQFFPQSGILSEDGIQEHIQSDMNPSGPYPLRRMNTGITDIVGHDNGSRPGGYILVVDGAALSFALSDEPHKKLLLRLATQCDGVICCRVSPLQKALVVKLVKDGLGVMTLAIGDGANDVSMIQAADVGVGISGEEGLQAVNSSDYAIAQFRYLKRLLLVHGHWSYARNGNMIVNFFYKNIVCIGVLWWFQIYCAWSSQFVFEYTYLLFWNSFWTIVPVIAMGLFDRNADDHVLMALPELYRPSREGKYFSLKLFLLYMLDGTYQSAVIFFLVLYAYFSPTSRPDGYDVYQFEFSTTMAIAAIMVVTVFVGVNISTWTGWVFFALGIEIVLIWAYTAIYSIIKPGWFTTPVYGNDHYLFRSAYFWFGIFLTVPIALLPRLIAKAYRFTFNPTDIDRVRYLHKLHPEHNFGKDRQKGGMDYLKKEVNTRRGAKRMSLLRRFSSTNPYAGSRTDMATGLRTTTRTGFDFAMEENGVALRRLQSNISQRSLPLQGNSHRKRRTSILKSLSRTVKRKRIPSTLHEEEVPPVLPKSHDR